MGWGGYQVGSSRVRSESHGLVVLEGRAAQWLPPPASPIAPGSAFALNSA